MYTFALEAISSILGFAFLAWILLVLFGVIPSWLWKPLRTRKPKPAADEVIRSFSLADLAVLVVYLALVYAAISTARGDPVFSDGAALLLAASCSLLAVAVWIIGLQILDRADIGTVKRRLAFQLVALPSATIGPFLLGVAALFLTFEALADRPPQVPDQLLAIGAGSLPITACARLTSRWIASEPSNRSLADPRR
jgi:hypothetical protein